MPVTRSSGTPNLMLPGNIQAVTESPVLARASGVHEEALRRYRRPGDEGQVLADIEAPELDAADLAGEGPRGSGQRRPSSRREAACRRDGANENLARIHQRPLAELFEKGVVSRQENDTYQMQWQAQ